jgi:hypothetical protein
MRILQMRALEKDNLTFNRTKTFGGCDNSAASVWLSWERRSLTGVLGLSQRAGPETGAPCR